MIKQLFKHTPSFEVTENSSNNGSIDNLLAFVEKCDKLTGQYVKDKQLLNIKKQFDPKRFQIKRIPITDHHQKEPKDKVRTSENQEMRKADPFLTL